MSFLPLGAGIEMRSPAKKFILNAAQQKAVEARNLGRRRKEIAEGTNVEQRVFDNPDLRAIFLGRREVDRTLPPIIRGGKEYTDPSDPGQAGLYKGGLFGQIKDLESQEKSYTEDAESLEAVSNYFNSSYRGYSDRDIRGVLNDVNIKDKTLIDTIAHSYSHYYPENFHKNIEAAKEFLELSFLVPDAKDGDTIFIDHIDELVGEHNLVDDIDRDDEYENVGDNKYRYTTTVTSLYEVSDKSKFDIIRKRTYGPFVHEYLENGEEDFDAHDDDEDYYPEDEYFLSLKKVLPKPKGRYYGRAK
jgi:hypothetical protein